MATIEPRLTDVDYVQVECKSALNPVKNMGFAWSLNPYMGCEHRCAFCYVRAFELRADRPPDDRYGRSIRVKVNVASVLERELSSRSWRREMVVIGAATDPYQPAEGRFKLTRQCLKVMLRHSNPAGLITRGPMIVRDIDVLTDLARSAELQITVSIPTVDDEIWRASDDALHERCMHDLRELGFDDLVGTEVGFAGGRCTGLVQGEILDGRAKAVPLEVRIQDNGPGVPLHLRDQLFEPFVTTKTNGTGLGLALVAKLVAAHGGVVDFESEPGRTSFRVLLPLQSHNGAG